MATAKMTKKYKSLYRARNLQEGMIGMHVLIAEKALGKKLPGGAEVHHVDGNGHNNAPENLVICPDRAYHKLLHKRTRALDACGHADWLKCVRCGEYGDPRDMKLSIPKDQTSARGEHKLCAALYNAKQYAKRKAA